MNAAIQRVPDVLDRTITVQRRLIRLHREAVVCAGRDDPLGDRGLIIGPGAFEHVGREQRDRIEIDPSHAAKLRRNMAVARR